MLLISYLNDKIKCSLHMFLSISLTENMELITYTMEQGYKNIIFK